MSTQFQKRQRAFLAGLLAFGAICWVPVQAVAKQDTRASCARATPSRALGCIVGEYSLTMTPETGASLILADNNRFDWYYSDPNGRKYATGRWQLRPSGGVVLTADQPDPNAAVFELVSQEPWDELAEFRLRYARQNEAQAVAESKCPLFIGASVRMSEPPVAAARSEAATVAANAALAKARAAKSLYERAAAAAVAGSASQRTALIDAAESARNTWNQAGFELERTHQIAGLPIPNLGLPTLPSVCTVPVMIHPADVPADQWFRGISINIDNASDRFLVTGIKATLTYHNGRTVNLTTNTSGLAFAPFDPNARVVQISLSTDTPLKRSRRFVVGPRAQGVFNLTVNGDLLNAPPFGQLSLRSVGEALVSTTYLPGRYERVSGSN
jgi:hypothetical protein